MKNRFFYAESQDTYFTFENRGHFYFFSFRLFKP
jgi:hypothetical protein